MKSPDAIFPDWFTTHKNNDIPEGVFILYPMRHHSRQLERDEIIIERLKKQYTHFIDLTKWESRDLALEGKGSLVFDYRNQKIFCSLSQRANKEVVDDLINEWNKISRRPYRPVTFSSFDKHDDQIYHTDCMLTLLHDHVVVSLVCIKDENEKSNLIKELTDTKINKHTYEIIDITRDEVEGMCANMFNLRDGEGNNAIIMSDRARRTYEESKFELLNSRYKILVANIDMIEYVGGGSTRCMLAEKF